MTSTQRTAYYQLVADLGTYSTTAPTTINSVATNPLVPTNTDNVVVTANVTAAPSTTISSVALTYDTGVPATTTVFTETMGTAAGAFTTAANLGANNAWTVNFAQPQPNGPFSQTTAANHGTGNAYGLEMNRGTPNLTDNYLTTTNAINASGGTAAYVEFYVATANLGATSGWALQTSPDGAAWTTRLSETASNHAYPALPYHYDLTPAERVSTLKLRFQFAGNGPTTPASKISFDDIKVVTTTGSSTATLPMTASAGGNYTATIPAQASGSSVNYTILATDSAAGVDVVSSSYNVITAAPALTVTPASGFSSSGSIGSGSYSPASATYTITNSGTGSMNWTASKTGTWLNLSSTSGTLVGGASTTVTASINTTNANSLGLGSYSDTLTFSNTTGGTGNTTRAASLIVTSNAPPAAPVLVALPAFSQGAVKAISWTAVAGATSYTLQISATADFSTVLANQTVTSPTASVANLTNGVTYYYRVLATNNIGSSIYSNVVSSQQDSVAPLVAITSPASGTNTAANTITVNGTSSDAVSGISKVTVNGVTASTANNFATWSITVPLGFGTNGITAVAYDGAGNATTTPPITVTLSAAQTYNPLIIPEVITGTTFDLTLHTASKQFLTGAATNTYAYNNMLFWGPTLIMNKGDWVQMNVTNNLPDTTTTHWHGFHIPAIMDGGPHQTIPAGTTWRPSFKVDNNAGLYWYHPHLHEFTQQQLARGAGGMIIIRDPQETALNLPRTYGVDDIPLALTSRRFTTNQIVTTASAYGDQMVVNGTLNPQVSLPAQYVRLRLLNAEMERSYNLGFSDNRTFYLIATDGGLVNAPVALTRLILGVGERAEILVNLGADTIGSSLDLVSYNAAVAAGTTTAADVTESAFPTGFTTDYPGGEPGQNGQFGSLLNNKKFTLLHINVAAATANPVSTFPGTLASNTYWSVGDVTNNRAIAITGGIAGATDWAFDNQPFSANVINQTINLNAVERWTITNNSGFSHTIHIHDIQFYPVSRTRTGGFNGVASYEGGWKDTIYVQRNSTVQVIAKFDTFASNTNPFMYHCHFSPHEDEGLMAQFLVVNNAVEDLAIASFTRVGNNQLISLDFKATPGTTYTLQHSLDMNSWTDIGSVTSDGSSANFTETDAGRLSQARGFYRVKIPTIP